MARPAKRVDCNESAKTRLLEIDRSRKEQSGLSLRAKIVLQCVEGKPKYPRCELFNAYLTRGRDARGG